MIDVGVDYPSLLARLELSHHRGQRSCNHKFCPPKSLTCPPKSLNKSPITTLIPPSPFPPARPSRPSCAPLRSTSTPLPRTQRSTSPPHLAASLPGDLPPSRRGRSARPRCAPLEPTLDLSPLRPPPSRRSTLAADRRAPTRPLPSLRSPHVEHHLSARRGARTQLRLTEELSARTLPHARAPLPHLQATGS